MIIFEYFKRFKNKIQWFSIGQYTFFIRQGFGKIATSCVIANVALPIKVDHGHQSTVNIDEEPACELESENTIKVMCGT